MSRALLLILALLVQDATAANVRRQSVKDAFIAQQACPATALHQFPCPGFIIDDKTALDCGGKDVVSNKQWLTVTAAKKKDRWERSYPGCKHRTTTPPPAGA